MSSKSFYEGIHKSNAHSMRYWLMWLDEICRENGRDLEKHRMENRDVREYLAYLYHQDWNVWNTWKEIESSE